MPKNKRPNRKPGGKRPAKRAAAENIPGGGAEAGSVPNVKGAKSIAKTYGLRKSSRSPISPAMNRRSARGR